jgi:hypothetical protein
MHKLNGFGEQDFQQCLSYSERLFSWQVCYFESAIIGMHGAFNFGVMMLYKEGSNELRPHFKSSRKLKRILLLMQS